MKTQGESQVSRASEAGGQFEAAWRVLEEAIAARAFPGCAFGVLAGGEVAISGAAGRFTYEESAPEVAPETVFDVASLTKVVATTAAAMLLVERGRLDLDTPLGQMLPGFVAGRPAGDAARQVRIRHLLAHNSGLPGYVELFRTASTGQVLLEACERLTLEAAPGARAEYSDPGFILLGKALETPMGEGLDTWAGRAVFAPLAMTETGFCPAPEMRNSIPPTEVDETFRHRRIQGEVQDENAFLLGGVAGHAGVFSNVPDLLRFAGAILGPVSGNGRDGKTHLFDRATVEQFAKRQPPDGSSQALGWDTPSENSSAGRHFGKQTIGHLGYSGCSLWIDLAAGVAIVMLTNRTWPDRRSQLIREVRPVFHNAIREALQI